MYPRRLTAFLLGGLMALYSPAQCLLILSLLSMLFLIAVWLLSWLFKKRGLMRRLSQYTVSLSLLFGGYFITALQFYYFNHDKIVKSTIETVEGCVESTIVSENGKTKFILNAQVPDRKRALRLLVTSYIPEDRSQAKHPPELQIGSCWRLRVKLKTIRAAANEYGFDYEKYLFATRVHGRASMNNWADANFIGFNDHRLLRLRHNINQKLITLSGASTSTSLLAALSVGMRDGLKEHHWQVLRRTGTSHLLAISGLHIGLAATIGFCLARWLPFGLTGGSNLIDRGTICALIIASSYAAMAGFPVSTQRALLMLVLWSACRLLRINVSAILILILALIVLLVIDPFSLASASLWLSAGAVACIVLISRGLLYSRHSQYKGMKWLDYPARLLKLQIALLLLMAPLVVPLSHGLSWVSIPVNVLIIPLFSMLIVPGVLLMLTTVLLDLKIQHMVAHWLDVLLQFIWRALDYMAAFDWAFVEVKSTSLMIMGPVVVVACIVQVSRGWKTMPLILALLLPMFFISPPLPKIKTVSLDVMDVGQALAVLIQTNHSVLLYDTGNAWTSGDSATSLLIPVLTKRGIKRVDHLVVSHADRDHAGGASNLVGAVDVDKIWLGEAIASLGQTDYCTRGIKWSIDQIDFEFLHPDYPQQFDGNEQSCVLLISGKQFTILLTGDVGAIVERRIAGRLHGKSIDLIIGAHHGSLGSSDQRFVNALQARYVVFSNGFDNQWGMPREQIVARWEAAGTQVLTTAREGQIRLLGTPDGLELKKRFRRHRFGAWRWPK